MTESTERLAWLDAHGSEWREQTNGNYSIYPPMPGTCEDWPLDAVERMWGPLTQLDGDRQCPCNPRTDYCGCDGKPVRECRCYSYTLQAGMGHQYPYRPKAGAR